jgi:hypothetical protein
VYLYFLGCLFLHISCFQIFELVLYLDKSNYFTENVQLLRSGPRLRKNTRRLYSSRGRPPLSSRNLFPATTLPSDRVLPMWISMSRIFPKRSNGA